MSYIISTICYGSKYEVILQHWLNKINSICNHKEICVINKNNIDLSNITSYEYAWWDIIRLKKNIELFYKNNLPIVHIDIDIIIENDIQEIVDLPYDFIISTEIGGNQSFPKECSQILGFGVCSGFYVIKRPALNFLYKILYNMKNKVYNSLSDQVNIMNYIINNKYQIKEEECILKGKKFTNKIIEIDDIKICVLNFDIITRDPIVMKDQFANHINIDNVGGVNNFIKYFYEPLQNLPLTCRCGKKHLGDNNQCNHIEIRKQYFQNS